MRGSGLIPGSTEGDRAAIGGILLNRGHSTDRHLQAGQVVDQAVSLPVDDPADLTSQICRNGHAYWRGLPSAGPIPTRETVDPSAMRGILPYTFMVDVVDRGADFRYRLVGTDIVAHTPRDNTGLLLSHIDGQGSQRRLIALYAAVTAGASPRFQRIAYRTRIGLRSWYETVVCPLADPASPDDIAMLIGWAEHFHQPIDRG